MAEKATIYKANVQVADMDRNHFGDYALTLALHPSETLERMMVRLLAFCLRADDNLSFTRGLSSVDEPELWLKHDDGRILNWIEVGQPLPDRLKKASSQAQAVEVFCYGRGLDVWAKTHQAAIAALPKVTLWKFDADELAQAVELIDKTMNFSVTITESLIYLNDAKTGAMATLQLQPFNT